jgi:hypothetical protein
LSLLDIEQAYQAQEAENRRRLAAHKAIMREHTGVVMTEPHPEDTRTPLQRQEDDAAESFAKLPKAQKLGQMVDALIVEAKNQVKHNAPVSPSIVQQLEAIRALLS